MIPKENSNSTILAAGVFLGVLEDSEIMEHSMSEGHGIILFGIKKNNKEKEETWQD